MPAAPSLANVPLRRPSVRAVLGAVMGLIVVLLITGLRLSVVGDGPIDFRPFVEMLSDASTPVERWLVAGDGQAHALVAADPSLRSEDLYGHGSLGYAYRAQRPLMGVIAWSIAFGRLESIPVAVASVFVFSGLVLGAGLALHVSLRWTAVATTAALLITAGSPVAEPLGAGLALLGLAVWPTSHARSAALLFALSCLCRESLLLIPAAIAIHCLTERRFVDGIRLSLSAVPLLAWIGFVRVQTGALPWDAAGNGRLGLPFQGLVAAAPRWTSAEVLLYGLLIAALVQLWRAGGQWRIAGVLHGLFATTMGEAVWGKFGDFGRVLLPALILGLIATSRLSPSSFDGGPGSGLQTPDQTGQPLR